jgi:hypothetical protein
VWTMNYLFFNGVKMLIQLNLFIFTRKVQPLFGDKKLLLPR